MRKLTLLAAAVAGAWAGWRAGRSGVVGMLAPPAARSAADAARMPPSLRSRELTSVGGQAAEKLVALLELGRERGLEVVQSVLGGRTGHAA